MSTAEESTIVYVPAFPDTRPGRRGALVETRKLADGEPAAIAFTSRQALVEALGGAQPWIALPLGELARWMGGTDRITIDPSVPEDARRWTETDLGELRDVLSPVREG